MSQVTGLLNDIRANVVSAAGGGLSDAEIAAKQIEIDAALEAINRIGNTTSFGSKKLLDGSAGFSLTGVDSSQVTDIQVIANAGGGSQTPRIEVTQAATAAALTFSDADATLDEDISLVLSGDEGTTVLEFSAGATLDQIATAVAASSQSTGVTASVDGNDLTLSSVAVGSDASVSLEVLEGTFDTGATTANGTDIAVNVDGIDFSGNGNSVEVSTATLQVDMEFAEGFTGEVDPITITGDALTFSFSPNVNDKATLGMPTITSSALGGSGRSAEPSGQRRFGQSDQRQSRQGDGYPRFGPRRGAPGSSPSRGLREVYGRVEQVAASEHGSEYQRRGQPDRRYGCGRRSVPTDPVADPGELGHLVGVDQRP